VTSGRDVMCKGAAVTGRFPVGPSRPEQADRYVPGRVTIETEASRIQLSEGPTVSVQSSARSIIW